MLVLEQIEEIIAETDYLESIDIVIPANTRSALDRLWGDLPYCCELRFDNWDLHDGLTICARALGIDAEEAEAYWANRIYTAKAKNNTFADPHVAVKIQDLALA